MTGVQTCALPILSKRIMFSFHGHLLQQLHTGPQVRTGEGGGERFMCLSVSAVSVSAMTSATPATNHERKLAKRSVIVSAMLWHL